MAKPAWTAFPHDAKAFTYAGDALKKAWPTLHAGDTEPYPDAKRAAALLKAAGKAAPKGVDADALAVQLQDAWRVFHRGDFKAAFDAGEALGPIGASVATKAASARVLASAGASMLRSMPPNCSCTRKSPSAGCLLIA